jgi:hypothetical protein
MSNDRNHPWLQPVWRRVIVVGICFAIAAFDIYHGNFGWALIFGGVGAYGIYIFFIAWDSEAKAEPERPDDADDGKP